MKKLTFALSLALAASTTLVAHAQYETNPVKPSIVRPAALGGYDGGGFTGYGYGYNYEYMPGSCACQPKGCFRGVCHGYDNCCLPCPTLICCLKRVGHMLDCLLPCYACKPTPCKPLGGLFGHGGCGPHLFAKGKCHGCGSGCGPACDGACPTCTSPASPPMPAATNPFVDDPPVPSPMPDEDAAKGVRRHPIWKNPAAPSAVPASPALSASAAAKDPRIVSNPYKLAAAEVCLTPKPPVPSAPAPIVMTSRRLAKPPHSPVATANESAVAPEAKSVLRRLSHEEEFGAALPIAAAPVASAIPAPPLPSLLPIQFESSRQAESAIPVNPLRRN